LKSGEAGALLLWRRWKSGGVGALEKLEAYRCSGTLGNVRPNQSHRALQGEFHAADVANTSVMCWSQTSETVLSHERIHCHLHVFVVFPEIVGFFYIRSRIWYLASTPKV
jgi:hypothetical protein